MIGKQELHIVCNGSGDVIIENSLDQDDIDKLAEDSEDIIRNEIYKNIERDLFNDANEYDSGTVTEISEVLQLTNDPLCREIGMSIATLGDRFVEYVEVQKRLREIADDLSRHYIMQHEDLIRYSMYSAERTRFEIFRRVASRIIEDGVNWGRIVALLYFAFRLILRPIGLGLDMCRRRMELTVQGICRKNKRSRKSQRKSAKMSPNYRHLIRVGYIAVPVIGVIATFAYFKS